MQSGQQRLSRIESFNAFVVEAAALACGAQRRLSDSSPIRACGRNRGVCLRRYLRGSPDETRADGVKIVDRIVGSSLRDQLQDRLVAKGGDRRILDQEECAILIELYDGCG